MAKGERVSHVVAESADGVLRAVAADDSSGSARELIPRSCCTCSRSNGHGQPSRGDGWRGGAGAASYAAYWGACSDTGGEAAESEPVVRRPAAKAKLKAKMAAKRAAKAKAKAKSTAKKVRKTGKARKDSK